MALVVAPGQVLAAAPHQDRLRNPLQLDASNEPPTGQHFVRRREGRSEVGAFIKHLADHSCASAENHLKKPLYQLAADKSKDPFPFFFEPAASKCIAGP